MQLWARRIRAKVRYYASSTILVTAASYYIWQFSGNSASDPDYTFVGSSANSWTTLTTLYNNYMCTYSKVKMQCQALDAALQRVTCTSCKRSVTALAVPTTLTSAIAQPDNQKRWNWNNGLSNNAKMGITSKGSTRGILGRALDPSLDRVPMANDPNEEWVHIFQWWNSAAINSNMYCAFYCTYWVELSDPKIASSV